ncbi:MAG: hypothetical protein ACJ73N_14660 [Bryobacteraceae bacterium]
MFDELIDNEPMLVISPSDIVACQSFLVKSVLAVRNFDVAEFICLAFGEPLCEYLTAEKGL